MKFDTSLFPKYSELSHFEKIILRTCCYFPPEKRRKRSKLIIEPDKYVKTLTNAYGQDFFSEIDGKKVLDFGCGEGQFVIAMAIQSKGQFEGVDIQDQYQVANEYVTKHQISNTNFYHGNSKELLNESYDIIISHDSFEHFEQPEIILDEMMRLLKPKGKLFIKFGPTWMSPYGRHMSGTFKKSRPWIHLLIPERNMIRVHSVYHNDGELYEKFSDLKGGLNKMTINKAKRIISNNVELEILKTEITPWRGLSFLTMFPVLKELFGSGAYFKCRKVSNENCEN